MSTDSDMLNDVVKRLSSDIRASGVSNLLVSARTLNRDESLEWNHPEGGVAMTVGGHTFVLSVKLDTEAALVEAANRIIEDVSREIGGPWPSINEHDVMEPTLDAVGVAVWRGEGSTVRIGDFAP